MKASEAKKLQNVFKSNLSEISIRRYKSEEPKRAPNALALQITRNVY